MSKKKKKVTAATAAGRILQLIDVIRGAKDEIRAIRDQPIEVDEPTPTESAVSNARVGSSG